MNTRKAFVVAASICVIAFFSGCIRQREVRRAEIAKATEAAEIAKKGAQAAAAKIVLDSSDTQGVEKQGEWPEGQGGEDWGSGCLFAFKGKGECKFIWRPNLPRAGDYRVSVWFGGDPNSDHATDSPYTVHFAEGRRTFNIDQTKASGGWKVLGIFPFNAGKAGYVELTNNANGNVVADGVQFEWVK
jgi:hypothetical protein